MLRILDKDALKLDLTQLGFDDWSLEKFSAAIHQPYGMTYRRWTHAEFGCGRRKAVAAGDRKDHRQIGEEVAIHSCTISHSACG